MFFSANDRRIRYIGRWAPLRRGLAATAPGAFFELSFKGTRATLHFDIEGLTLPFPHLWLQMDDGERVELPVDRFLRVCAKDDGWHRLRIVYKSARETASRWHHPLEGYLLFEGFEARDIGDLQEDPRKTLELVGDSITEGVLIDPEYAPSKENDQLNRPYQDDVLATYGTLLAEKLDLIPINVGYGAVGVTKGGCGGVPSAPEAYPFCFENAPYTAPPAYFVLINHGTNDRHNAHLFKEGYVRLLDLIYQRNPQAKVIALIPFCGAFREELLSLIPAYNAKNAKDVLLIDTEGWLPAEPLHPLREGHLSAAEKIAAILADRFGLTVR